jgi:transposase
VYGAGPQKSQRAPLPAAEVIDVELRKVGVTLRLLHVEYRAQHPDGYGYTQFCDHYGRWKQRQGVVMRHAHRAGEKLFSDYSGKTPHWIDPDTGEVQEVELFVAVLGASNYTYAEVTPTQRIADWVGSHTRAVEFFEGVAALVVPDQLKSAVNQPCRYEPEIQRTFQEWAEHYDTVVVPARPAERPHPEQGYRSCLGIIRLQKRSGTERREQACARAHAARARSYKHVDSILRNGLDRLPLSGTPKSSTDTAAPLAHEHVRGEQYYR